ncbi:MAG: hypothetical protein AAB459_04525 [Patescibacteria group bacterium]
MNRGNRAPQQTTAGGPAVHAPHGRKGSSNPIIKIITVGLLFSATALIVALCAYLVLGGGNASNEKKFVDSSKMQAVFLNGGQVYFGKLKDLNKNYLRVSDIYYLRVNQQVQPNQQNNGQAQQNDISLVKLGCELHGPQDEMLINREQVIFWENLKDDGQVAVAVKKYISENPNGQQCATNNNNQNNPATGNTNQNTNTNTNTNNR